MWEVIIDIACFSFGVELADITQNVRKNTSLAAEKKELEIERLKAEIDRLKKISS